MQAAALPGSRAAHTTTCPAEVLWPCSTIGKVCPAKKKKKEKRRERERERERERVKKKNMTKKKNKVRR